MTRTRFQWNVRLQSDRGEVVNRTFAAYWSPEHDLTKSAVAHSAAAEAWFETGKKVEFAAVAEPELLTAA